MKNGDDIQRLIVWPLGDSARDFQNEPLIYPNYEQTNVK